MNVTKKIDNRASQIEAACKYINRSQQSRERSMRPLMEFSSWGLLLRLKSKEVKP